MWNAAVPLWHLHVRYSYGDVRHQSLRLNDYSKRLINAPSKDAKGTTLRQRLSASSFPKSRQGFP